MTVRLPALALGLAINVYERGDAGAPTTTFVANLAEAVTSCEFSIADQFGFETMTCAFVADFDDARDWLTFGLMRSVVVLGPDAAPWQSVWEGFLETVTIQFGQEQRSVSVREMANRVRVNYQTVLGTQGSRPTSSTFFEDSASYALYGRKDQALALGNISDGTEVDDYGTTMLARLAHPMSAPSSEIRTGDLGEIRVTLTFAGWYATTEWILASNTSTTKTQTTTQIGTILTNLAAQNAFISTATTNIDASGVTATEYIAADTPYREKIEALMARGNGTYPYAWGVYENREFHASEWVAADPTATTYQRHLGEAAILDSAGGEVAFWDVRPNAMYQVVDLLDVAPVASQQDAAARFYVARTVCTIDESSLSLRLEPAQGADLESVLITKYL